MELSLLKQVMEEMIPFNKFLGIIVERMERGNVRLALPFRDELIGDPLKRAIHGGVLSTLADVAGGAAAWSAIEDPMARVSTVDLRIDYLRPGRAHAIIAESSVVRLGGRLAVTDMKMFHPGGDGEPIATGKGVYAVKIPKHPKVETT
ncbi:MAG: thioesterase family protein [Polyangiaceae bacterium]|nr:thioesterase family protein [Polyangiaceae bacterium]